MTITSATAAAPSTAYGISDGRSCPETQAARLSPMPSQCSRAGPRVRPSTATAATATAGIVPRTVSGQARPRVKP